MIEKSKPCRKCGGILRYVSYKNKACVACKTRYELETKDTRNKYQVVYRKTLRGRAHQLFHSSKGRAKRDSLDFNLTQRFIEELFVAINNKCQQTGITFDFEPCVGIKENPIAPSLDRIDSTKGYTVDNIQLVCNWYNHAKGELSDESIWKLLKTGVSNKM